MKQILIKSNIWAGGPCGRKKCLPCENGDGKQNCFEKNVVYDIKCLSCCSEESGNKSAVYTGQTSQSLHERGMQHLQKLLTKSDSSPLYKHVMEEHDGKFVDFQMKVVKKHFTAFSRLVHEAVRIERISKSSNITVLNSKGEYGRVTLPRLTIFDREPEKERVTKNSLSATKVEVDNDRVNRDGKECIVEEEDSNNDQKQRELGSQSTNNSIHFTKSSPEQQANPTTSNKPNEADGKITKKNRRTYRHVATNFKFRQKFYHS